MKNSNRSIGDPWLYDEQKAKGLEPECTGRDIQKRILGLVGGRVYIEWPRKRDELEVP